MVGLGPAAAAAVVVVVGRLVGLLVAAFGEGMCEIELVLLAVPVVAVLLLPAVVVVLAMSRVL